MMNIAHLVVMMADSTSVTWCELANDAPGEYEVIYRSRIHAVRGEISHMCNFGPLAPLGHLAVDSSADRKFIVWTRVNFLD